MTDEYGDFTARMKSSPAERRQLHATADAIAARIRDVRASHPGRDVRVVRFACRDSPYYGWRVLAAAADAVVVNAARCAAVSAAIRGEGAGDVSIEPTAENQPTIAEPSSQ